MRISDDRYSRQTMLKEIGSRGQEKLAASSVLIAGAGGLGSASALYLAAAGVGRILIADNDCVETSNLNRQIIHSEKTLGMKKADSALQRLRSLNSEIDVIPVYDRLNANTIDFWLKDVDLMVDACDTYETRVVLNRASLRNRLPWIYGGIQGFDGLVSTFVPGKTACFECTIKSPASSMPAPIGFVGAAAGMVASIQAMEAIKLLLGIGTCLENRMIRIQGLGMKIHTVSLSADPGCHACRKKAR